MGIWGKGEDRRVPRETSCKDNRKRTTGKEGKVKNTENWDERTRRKIQTGFLYHAFEWEKDQGKTEREGEGTKIFAGLEALYAKGSVPGGVQDGRRRNCQEGKNGRKRKWGQSIAR